MKKKFLLLAMIIFAGICFSSLKKEDGVQACDANVSTGSMVKKKNMRIVPADYTEDADASYNIFMNPFTQL